MNLLVFALLEIGHIGGNSINAGSGTSAITNLNNILKTVCVVVGAIIILVAIIKLVLSYTSESADQKMQGSMMFGVGIVLISVGKIMTSLQITEKMTPVIMAKNVITIICSFMSYAGAIFALMAIVSLVMSIVEENPQAKVTGSRHLGVSIGLLSSSALGAAIKVKIGTLMGGSPSADASLINLAFGFIANVCTYIGAGLAVMAIWHFVHSITEESSAERAKFNKMLIGAIAMLSMRAIIKLVFKVDLNALHIFS